MQSYSAARKSFSVLEMFAWVIIVLGGIAAVAAFIASSSNILFGIVAAVPGIGICALGFFGLAYVQTSRATVDSAEYAQQSLKLARDQFEISKQLLKHATATQTASYEPPSNKLQNTSYDTAEQAPEPAPTKETQAGNLIEYGGHQIVQEGSKFLFNEKEYDTLIDAKLAVDGVRWKKEVAKIEVK